MVEKDKTRSVRMALNLKMIDLGQFNEIMDLWESSPDRNTNELMREKGFITKEQYQHLATLFDSLKDVVHNFDISDEEYMQYEKKTRYSKQEQLSEKEKKELKEDEIVFSDHFTLRGVLGEGGIGCVFLCYDKNIEREVAIKEIMTGDSGDGKTRSLARFVREAKITGQLEHPGIVPVYELNVKEDGTLYYVMKHVKGKTLFKAINECSADKPEEAFRRRLQLFGNLIDVCEAMGYAHSKGVIHRDLKPSNIILGEFGETIILDWGTAKKITDEGLSEDSKLKHLPQEDTLDADLTRSGELLGTPSYMAPEQIDPKFGEVGSASDVYALGITLFIMLTGEKPYQGPAREIMDHTINDDHSPSPRSHGSYIPPELAAICEKAMSKNKEERFQDASELVAELKAYRDGRIVSVYSYSKSELLNRFVTRNKLAITAIVALVVSIITGAGFAINYAVDADKARDTAEEALIDVTKLAEYTMPLSRNVVSDLNQYFNNVSVEMSQIAEALKFTRLSKKDVLLPYLKQLHGRHKEVDAFMIVLPPGEIVTAYPNKAKGLIEFTQKQYKNVLESIEDKNVLMGNTFKTKKNFYAFTIQVPIIQNSRVAGSLLALLRNDKAIPSAMPFDPVKSDYQVWCMQEDGYIVYDEDNSQIGKYLFSDEMYAKYPELSTFGKEIKKDPLGIGHYSSTEGDHKIFKIAAWDTFKPLDQQTWKIVVSYPYTTK